VNARDGLAYFYDVNALSNFVANAAEVIGFDPFVDLVDFLLERAADASARRHLTSSEHLKRLPVLGGRRAGEALRWAREVRFCAPLRRRDPLGGLIDEYKAAVSLRT